MVVVEGATPAIPAIERRRFAVVIGGGRGIGRAAAEALARRGFDVAVAARDAGQVEQTAERLRSHGVRGVGIPADVTEEASVSGLLAEVSALTDGVDMLVNSAGDAVLGGLDGMSPAELEAMLGVNLVGPYRTIYHFRGLLRAAGGQVVNVGSRAGRAPYPDALAYGTAKAGLIYLTRALSRALAPGIRVNAISPGAVATELRRRVFPAEDQASLMKADLVGELIGSLADPTFSILNGAVIDVPW